MLQTLSQDFSLLEQYLWLDLQEESKQKNSQTVDVRCVRCTEVPGWQKRSPHSCNMTM